MRKANNGREITALNASVSMGNFSASPWRALLCIAPLWSSGKVTVVQNAMVSFCYDYLLSDNFNTLVADDIVTTIINISPLPLPHSQLIPVIKIKGMENFFSEHGRQCFHFL